MNEYSLAKVQLLISLIVIYYAIDFNCKYNENFWMLLYFSFIFFDICQKLNR